MSLRRIPLHKVSVRPILFMGADRELALFSLAVTFTLCAASANLKVAVGGGVFWLTTIFALRLMAKADPLLRQVWVRNLKYKKHYPARSQPWRGNFRNWSTPFGRPQFFSKLS